MLEFRITYHTSRITLHVSLHHVSLHHVSHFTYHTSRITPSRITLHVSLHHVSLHHVSLHHVSHFTYHSPLPADQRTPARSQRYCPPGRRSKRCASQG